MTRSLVAPVFLRRFFFLFFACAFFFCLSGVGLFPCPPARTGLPAPLPFLKASAIERRDFVAPLGPCVELPVSLWPGFSFGLDRCFFFQIALMALTTF